VVCFSYRERGGGLFSGCGEQEACSSCDIDMGLSVNFPLINLD